jgi:molybdopterin converting factor small subunit
MYPINPGITVGSLLEQLKIPPKKAKLIFIDGIKANLTSTLNGGERVGIFPPVGGG